MVPVYNAGQEVVQKVEQKVDKNHLSFFDRKNPCNMLRWLISNYKRSL
jgi:hypothetical protein